jgi:hypothetical protein
MFPYLGQGRETSTLLRPIEGANLNQFQCLTCHGTIPVCYIHSYDVLYFIEGLYFALQEIAV